MMGDVGECWTAGDEELLLALGAAQRAMNETFAGMLPVLAEVASRGLAVERGYRDVADLLRDAQNVSRSVARARVRAAEDLEPARTLGGEPTEAVLPVLAAAVHESAVSAEHVRVIQATLASLPPHLDEHRPSLEADLTEHSRTLDPDAVAKLGRAALALLDPDGPRPREPRPTRNRLTLRAAGDGFEARGWFDRESAATLRTALSPLSAPAAPAPCDGSCGGDAGIGGDGAAQPDLPECFGGPRSGERTGCPGHPERDEAERDPRSGAERLGDALVELARRGLMRGDPGLEAGEPVRVTVTVPLEVLESRSGAGLLGLGDGTLPGPIAAATARKLACDARVVPIVLGTRGEPLDVGREARLATRAQRRALAQRDGGCAFPGCDCPPQWCVAHHVRHWIDGGATELGNLVLLCARHHTVIHTQEWEITMDGGFPLFHPPPWVPGGPRRNPVHRPDLVGSVPAPREPVRIVDLAPSLG